MDQTAQTNQPKQQQRPLGTESAMTPQADHGEQSYRGCGRLAGKRAPITGADNGIGKAEASPLAARAPMSPSLTSTSTTMPLTQLRGSRMPDSTRCQSPRT